MRLDATALFKGRLDATHKNMRFTHDYENVIDQNSQKINYNKQFTVDYQVALLPMVSLIAFLTYAVFVSHTATINAACGGEELWIFMIVRLVFLFGGIFVLLFPTLLLGTCLRNFATAAAVVAVVYLATMIGFGAHFGSAALSNATCASALSAASVSNSPILAILCMVFVGLDACALLGGLSFVYMAAA